MPIFLSKSYHSFVKYSNELYEIQKENDFRRTTLTGYTKDGYIRTQKTIIHTVTKVIKQKTQERKDKQVINYNRQLLGLSKFKPIKQEKIKKTNNISVSFDGDTIIINH